MGIQVAYPGDPIPETRFTCELFPPKSYPVWSTIFLTFWQKDLFPKSFEQCSKSRNVIPLNPGWLIGIPRSWIIIIFNTLGSIIPYKYHHQPTGVLQSLLISSYFHPLVFRISSPCCPSNNHHLGCAAFGTFTSKGGASTHCRKS